VLDIVDVGDPDRDPIFFLTCAANAFWVSPRSLRSSEITSPKVFIPRLQLGLPPLVPPRELRIPHFCGCTSSQTSSKVLRCYEIMQMRVVAYLWEHAQMFLNRVVKIGNRGNDLRLRGVAISATCPDPAHVGDQLRSLQTFDSFGRAGSPLRPR